MKHIHVDCYAMEFYGRDGKKAKENEVEKEEEEEVKNRASSNNVSQTRTSGKYPNRVRACAVEK